LLVARERGRKPVPTVRNHAPRLCWRLFLRVRLELLFERGKFGERRIRIRRLVVAILTAAVRLRVVLFALGTLNLVAAVAAAAARTFVAALIVLAVRTLMLMVAALLAILRRLPVPLGSAVTRALVIAGLLGFRFGCFKRARRLLAGGSGRGNVRGLLLAVGSAVTAWRPIVGAATRTPDLDEFRLRRLVP